MIRFKKGAMFGLDARIALAIFGALSVISGAALYSAIKEAKITAIITEVAEIEKAITAYYLDTGVMLEHSSANVNRDLTAKGLIVAPTGVTNWQGPYYPDAEPSTDNIRSRTLDVNVTMPYREDIVWANSADGTCTKASTEKCYVYLWYALTDTSLQKTLEKKIDGVDRTDAEDFTGNFKYYSSGVFFKTSIPYKKEWSAS